MQSALARPAPTPAIDVPDAVLAKAASLYERGLYLQAWREVEPFGPLRVAEGAEPP
mgnify:CR=1 FL=1